MLTNPPVPYDFCVGVPISRLLTVGSTPVQHSVLNVKALVGAFNQKKALVGAFSVITFRLIVCSSTRDRLEAARGVQYRGLPALHREQQLSHSAAVTRTGAVRNMKQFLNKLRLVRHLLYATLLISLPLHFSNNSSRTNSKNKTM